MSTIDYRHPARTPRRAPRIGVRGLVPVQTDQQQPARIVLQRGESVVLTGPNAGRVTR